MSVVRMSNVIDLDTRRKAKENAKKRHPANLLAQAKRTLSESARLLLNNRQPDGDK